VRLKRPKVEILSARCDVCGAISLACTRTELPLSFESLKLHWIIVQHSVRTAE